MGQRRFSILAMLFSLLGAGIAYLVGEWFLKLGSDLPEYLQVGLYFGMAAMFVSIMVIVSQKVSPNLIGVRWKEQYFKTSLKLFVPTTLLMVGISAGVFQMLYGLEISETKTIQDIVIAVDCSSSMKATDPNGERFSAINHLIDGLKGDKRVALMTFSQDHELKIDFTKVSNQAEKEAFKNQLASMEIRNNGQTGIYNVVGEAYDLIQEGGRRASLILVSDGSPTDGSAKDIPGLVEVYKENHIPIYTIGMMETNSNAEAYLKEIAELTEGVYYNTSDTTMLKEVFGKIEYNEEKGTIISARTGSYMASTMHQVLRVVFLVVIAMLIALALGIMFDNRYLVKGMMIGALIGGLVGGFLAEKMFLEDTAPELVRLVYWFFVGISLMSFTWSIVFKEKYYGTRTMEG